MSFKGYTNIFHPCRVRENYKLKTLLKQMMLRTLRHALLATCNIANAGSIIASVPNDSQTTIAELRYYLPEVWVDACQSNYARPDISNP